MSCSVVPAKIAPLFPTKFGVSFAIRDCTAWQSSRKSLSGSVCLAPRDRWLHISEFFDNKKVTDFLKRFIVLKPLIFTASFFCNSQSMHLIG